VTTLFTALQARADAAQFAKMYSTTSNLTKLSL